MTNLQSLRQAKRLVRGVLLWFVFSFTAAIASPLLQPQSANWVCTAYGMAMVPDDDASTSPAQQGMHCVLCATTGAPPMAELSLPRYSDSLSYVLQPIAAAHVAWRAHALLLVRGPPSRL
jgi:hypothetical protein